MATNGRFYGLKRCDARVFRLGKIGKVRKSDEPTGAQGEEIVGLAARAFHAPLYATQGQPGTVLSEPAAHTRAFESGAT